MAEILPLPHSRFIQTPRLVIRLTCKDFIPCQHAMMRIRCPNCSATYAITDVNDEAILICHRCAAEFDLTDGRVAPEIEQNQYAPDVETFADGNSTRENSPSSSDHGKSVIQSRDEEPGPELLDADMEPLAESTIGTSPAKIKEQYRPPRKIRLWLILFSAAAINILFWSNRDEADGSWIQSFLVNNGYKVTIRDHNWHILPESIKAQWIERIDHSLVLLIEGRVRNELQSTLPPPEIRISLLSGKKPSRSLREIVLPITMRPLANTIKHVPFISPPEDTTPVLSSATRGFILVLENIPGTAQTFSISAAANQL